MVGEIPSIAPALFDIKLEEKLGQGIEGAVYKITYNGEQCICKMTEMYLGDNIINYSNAYARQIDFMENCGNRHPDNFIQLRSYGVLFDDSPPVVTKKTAPPVKHVYYIYSPVMEGTLNPIRETIFNNEAVWFDMYKQILHSVAIMKMFGYFHCDIHSNNIMYKKSADNSYKWALIDYGRVSHTKFFVDPIEHKKMNGADAIDLIWSSVYHKEYVEAFAKFGAKTSAQEFYAAIRSSKIAPKCDAYKKYKPKKLSGLTKEDFLILIVYLYDFPTYARAIGYPMVADTPPVISEYKKKIWLTTAQHMYDNDYFDLIKKLEAIKQ